MTTAPLAEAAPPVDLEYKAAGTPGVLLASDDEQGIVEALVSVTGVVDEQGDLIEPGAYADTLTSRRSKGVRYHDWSRMAAKTLVQEEWLPGDPRLPARLPDGTAWPRDAGALYVKGQYNLETRDGREGYSNAKFYADEGQWSIGWRPAAGTAYRRKDGVRVLPKVHFYEWSDVLHGANVQTSTLGVKTAGSGGFGEGLQVKFDPGQPRAGDGKWTSGGGSDGKVPAGPGEGGPAVGPDWLRRVLAGDARAVRGAGGGAGGSSAGGKERSGAAREKAAERERRDKVEAAFDQERAAERERRDAAMVGIGNASGQEKKTRQTQERERRRLWQAAFDEARDAERARRREWAAAQRNAAKSTEHSDLAGGLSLEVDDDPLHDSIEEQPGQETKGLEALVETKVRDVLPGSYEERRDALRDAARAALGGPRDAHGAPEWWVYVVGTWDDRIVVNRSPRDDGEPQTWQIPYTINADGVIALGEMTRVELVAQIVPSTKTAETVEVSGDTVAAAVAAVQDATAILALASAAAGEKTLTAPAGPVGRLGEVVAELEAVLGAVTGPPAVITEVKTAEPSVVSDSGVVLTLADIHATLAHLRS